MGEEIDELLGQWLVEAQFLAHEFDRLLVGVHAGSQARRVAGQHVHEEEDEHGDDEQGRRQAEQAFDEVIEHGLSLV